MEKITRLSATTPSTTTLFLYTRRRRRQLTIDPCGKRKQIVAATHTHYLSILSNTRIFVFRWRTNYIVKKTLRFFFLNAIISISLNAPPKLDPVRVFKCACMTCNSNEKNIYTHIYITKVSYFFFFLVQLYKRFEWKYGWPIWWMCTRFDGVYFFIF